jgi:hypothetical protein
MRLPLLIACTLISFAAATASRSDYLSVKQKFSSIEHYRSKPGSRVPISSRELNAYVATELPLVAPDGIRQPSVELHGDNIATGKAKINFLKIQHARGKAPNWLMDKLLDGEHDVAVTARVDSAGGTATVHLQRVEVSGVPLEGAALDFVIKHYLLPTYPDAKIDQPFQLHYKMDHFEVKPGMAYVVMQK